MVGTLAEMRRMILAYGAQAVIGRAMGVRELRELDYAGRIGQAYYAREASGNWVEWGQQHPADNALLNWAMRLSDESD